MKIASKVIIVLGVVLNLLPDGLAGMPALPPVPAQDQGYPYTRSAQSVATAKLKDRIAVFAGSRYAWVRGYKVRLDEANWRAEALWRDGKILVPAAFAGVLDRSVVKPAPAPAYLANRWVYTLAVPRGSAPTITVEGQPYVDLAAEARRHGFDVYQNDRGLLVVGQGKFGFTGLESNLLDSVITLFDTPEKFAAPAIAARWIPSLIRQGVWTNHVKVTPEQLKVYEGPETRWAFTPKSEYNYTGLATNLFGSPVPPPGVYPRVLFSPQDVPMLAARVQANRLGQKSLLEMQYLFETVWWNTNTSDGKVFQKLAAGDRAGLEWPDDVSPTLVATFNTAQQFKGEKPGVFNTHVAYVPECLTAMALYCLLTDDAVHGRKAAAAVANYYRLREPLIDAYNAQSDTEFGGAELGGNGGTTAWRGMHGLVAHMDLGLSLDFAGKWMTAEEKDTMRRVIAKATYGRRAYGEDNTVRFRDVNWVGWDLPQFLALTAIEGLEGFDREAWESGADTVRAFCEWGIDDHGVVYESNGKTPGSFQFITLSMVALARHGDNLFGHPHWRKLLAGQIQMTSPDGRVTVNSGTQYEPYSRQFLSLPLTDEFKTFYPQERLADYLLTKVTDAPERVTNEYNRGWAIEHFHADQYRAGISKMNRLRLPSPTYPGFVPGALYDADFQPTTREDLQLPLDFSDPVQGVFSSYSDRSTNATWINLMVRPNHYLGAGHHHADAGMFHFSALGVDWFTQSPFDQEYAGHYFSLVQVDGESEAVSLPDWPATGILGWNAAGKYLGATLAPEAATASADLAYAYSYRWLTQSPPVWNDRLEKLGWEPETSPAILKIFAGTARYKMRPWWLTYNFANFLPTCRAPFNPMRQVWRSVGLVRGEHPYGFVVDDLLKDDASHLYQWQGVFNGGVWRAKVAGLPTGQVVLAYRPGDPDPVDATVRPALDPRPGEPLLLCCAVGLDEGAGAVERAPGPVAFKKTMTAKFPFPHAEDQAGVPQYFDRLVFARRGTAAHFRILLIPYRAGEGTPRVATDPTSQTVTVIQGRQEDLLRFTLDETGRTHLQVVRGGRRLLATQ